MTPAAVEVAVVSAPQAIDTAREPHIDHIRAEHLLDRSDEVVQVAVGCLRVVQRTPAGLIVGF